MRRSDFLPHSDGAYRYELIRRLLMRVADECLFTGSAANRMHRVMTSKVFLPLVAVVLVAGLLAARGGGAWSSESRSLASQAGSGDAGSSQISEQADSASSAASELDSSRDFEPPAASEAGSSAVPVSPTDSVPTTAPPTSDELYALYEDELNELIAVTERLRGLDFLSPPKFVLQDLESFLDGLANRQPEEFLETLDVWEIVYKLLGLLEPEDSLRQMYSDPVVAGYFLYETEEVFIPLTATGMSIGDRSVVVHELVHALTAQHFNWNDSLISYLENDKVDQYQALLAVVEGDAALQQTRYILEELTPEEREAIQALQTEVEQNSQNEQNSQTAGETDETEIPRFLLDLEYFPYIEGPDFLISILGIEESENGELSEEDLQKIDELYFNLPVSTEQIYNFEKYPSDQPLEVEHPVPELTGYELLTTRAWGMLGFVAIFDQTLGDEGLSKLAAEGWGGDRFSLWHKGEEVAFALTFRGDEVSDAEEMQQAMIAYSFAVARDASSSAANNFVWQQIDGNTLRLVVASEQEAGEELAVFYSDITAQSDTRISNENEVSAPSETSAVNNASTPSASCPTNDESSVNSDDLTALYKDELNEMIAVTERLRGLEFLCEPEVVFLDSESLIEPYLVDTTDESRPYVDGLGALYRLLGLVEPDVSPRQLYNDRIRVFVGAYYEPETKKIVVPIPQDGIDARLRRTLVHELVHALTDQHFNLRDTRNNLYASNGDQFLAFSAVIEGDATEATSLFSLEELNSGERDVQSASASNEETSRSADSSARSAIPQFLRDLSRFPYDYGSTFLSSLLGDAASGPEPEKDWQAVNYTYVNPPDSTEQVYFPEKYLIDMPLEVAHHVADLPDYELVETDTWGAAGFAVIFDQVLGREGPTRPAVEGWGGDRYSLWFNGSDVAMALTYRGDEDSDAEELATALREYISAGMNAGEIQISDEAADTSGAAVSGDTITATYTAIWNDEDFAWLSVEGDTLRFVAASDPAVGAELMAFYEAM